MDNTQNELMNTKEKREGLIPRMIRRWKFKKQFSKEELEEIKKIKRDAFLSKMRERAKKEGEEQATSELNSSMEI